MSLKKCKHCSERSVAADQPPKVECIYETWTMTAFVNCLCGEHVSISIPRYGIETASELAKMENKIKTIAEISWNVLND